MGTATKSVGRRARLKKGFPLADGRTPSSPPATSRKKKRPMIDPGKGSSEKVDDKDKQKRELASRRRAARKRKA